MVKRKTILQALEENQKNLTKLDVNFLLGKYSDDYYFKERTKLRQNVAKIIKDNNLIDTLKLSKKDTKNIFK